MLAGFSLQPSEVAKVTGLIWAASFLSKRIQKGEKITLIKRFLRPFFHCVFRPFFHLANRKKKENTFRSMIGYFCLSMDRLRWRSLSCYSRTWGQQG